jgi:hypothetical protein
MQLADARVSERPLFSERDRWFESAFLQRGVRCELDTITPVVSDGSLDRPRSAVRQTAACSRRLGSVSLRPAIGSDQAPERFEIADQNRRLAEIYQALAMPVLKNFVDAFPTASGHVAELSLGDVKLHRCAL